MGIHHEPPSGPDDDLGSDALAAEFSLFLASDPFRAQQMQLEASISLFCSELEEFGSVGLREVIRRITAEPPHAVVEDFRAFFLPSYEEGEKHLSDQLSLAGIFIDSTVSEQLSSEDLLSSIATDALSAVVISEVVLCLGAFALSDAMYECDAQLQSALVEPFIARVEEECERMGWLDISEKLSPATKRTVAQARYDLRLREAESIKKTLETSIDELTHLFEPLTQQAVERLPVVVSAFFEEYLTQPFLEGLTRYLRGNFEESFAANMSNLLFEKIDAIEFALETLRETMPS